jgi:hypothetical protein
MNCQEFELQIALYVGNDLEATELLLVEKHLADCQSCKQFMLEMQDSQLAFTKFGSPDIDEQVFSNLRASVLEQISLQKEKPSWWKNLFGFQFKFWQYATALSLIIGLFIISSYLLLVSNKVENNIAINNSNLVEKTIVKTPTQETPTIDKSVNDRKSEEPIELSQTSNIAKPVVKHINYIKYKKHTVKTENNASDNIVENPNIIASKTDNSNVIHLKQEPIKMEIQTKNPNIRIIWFTNKDEKTEKTQTNS